MRVLLPQEQSVPKDDGRYGCEECALDSSRSVKDAHEQFHEHLVGQDCAKRNHEAEDGNDKGITRRSLPIERSDGGGCRKSSAGIGVDNAAVTPPIDYARDNA